MSNCLNKLLLFMLASGVTLMSHAARADEYPRASLTNERLLLDTGSSERLEHWQTIQFKGQTDYSWILQGNDQVLRAHSRASASGYLLEQDINLQKFPFLNWRWRVEKPLPELDETQKNGDDYVARIYVIVSGGWFFWQTKALNYVWSSRGVKGQTWRNAYAPDNARMYAVRDSSDALQVWYSEKRNVLQDIQNWLGEDIHVIDAIALMTDSDDSQKDAIMYYGDIFFSAD